MLNFLEKTVRIDGCLVWMGFKTKEGYGRINTLGKNWLAHRYSFCFYMYNKHLSFEESDMKEFDVCHTCDNPPCVDPKHLFLGTAKDNIQDAIRKGRVGIKWKKLSPKIVHEIRTSSLMNKDLAAKFGVHNCTISRVKRGLRRKHVI